MMTMVWFVRDTGLNVRNQ